MTESKLCTEAGCGAPAYCRGLCSRHYQRARARERGVIPAASKGPRSYYSHEAFEFDTRENEKPESYESSPALADLARHLEAERDRLITAAADDRTKLETLRSIAREHRAQYRHTPCADWRKGAEVEL